MNEWKNDLIHDLIRSRVPVKDNTPRMRVESYYEGLYIDNGGCLSPDQQESLALAVKLAEELEKFHTCSIIEIAAINPSIMEFIKHWEDRAIRAETENSILRAQLDKLKESVYTDSHTTGNQS